MEINNENIDLANWLYWYQSILLAPMPPAATRIDCHNCNYKDVDGDGVPDGCNLPLGEKCIAPGKRGPWS